VCHNSHKSAAAPVYFRRASTISPLAMGSGFRTRLECASLSFGDVW
jgi:hypothetical protein